MGLYCISIYSFWSAYYILIHNDNKLVEVRYDGVSFSCIRHAIVRARSRYHSRSDSRAGRQRATAARVALCFVNIVFQNAIATSVKRKCDQSLLLAIIFMVWPDYARFVMIHILWFRQKNRKLNIKRRVQIRRLCPFALFANLIWIENCEFWIVTNHESRIIWPHHYAYWLLNVSRRSIVEDDSWLRD